MRETRLILLGISIGLVAISANLCDTQGLEAVSIRVDPPTTVEGGNFWIYCRVPRHVANREITIAVQDVSSHTYQVDGNRAPAMFSVLERDVPCWPELVVSCKLKTIADTKIAVKRVPVLGCSGVGI
jgi:hypothetical protein